MYIVPTLIARNLKSLEKALSSQRIKKKKIGLVPTMGAIHDGHLALVDKCLKLSQVTVVTIFINPMQFNNKKDLKNYPTSIRKDISILTEKKVNIIFIPKIKDIYPSDFSTFIELKKFDNMLCGKNRNGHFSGVATVVLKLFCLINPRVAFFGEKDFQQLFIIKKLVRDLNLNIDVQAVKTVRDKSGLALSSRNRLLSKGEKNIASKVNIILREISLKNLKSIKSILKKTSKKLYSEGVKKVEYLEVRNEKSLESYTYGKLGNNHYRVFVAVKVGKVRLIDNLRLTK
ncbi:MAG: pantoate--beta-alanine ligase [Pelagibacterales bacterium]|nr:pantoate--beta-alanine ligase [Pelagibacterales bacterium]